MALSDFSERYSRQMIFPFIGRYGQEKLRTASVAIVGQGALGTACASYLARAGVGRLILIDDDHIELSNLQRQTLFTESDIGRNKAQAAASHLREINSSICIDAISFCLTEQNAEELLGDAQLVLDATDNFAARITINSFCVPRLIPWIYAGVVKGNGMTLNILPGGPCFRCLMPEDPDPADEYPIAGTTGILSTTAPFLSALQCTEAIKILVHGSGHTSVRRTLFYFDLCENIFEQTPVARIPSCPVCGCQRRN